MGQAASRRPTSVGIDIAEERKGLDLVALDLDRTVLRTIGRLSVADAVAAAIEIAPAVVCIDSPSGWSLTGRSRAAERELGRLGISAFATGADPGDHPFYRWMRVGFSVYDALASSYDLFRGGSPMACAAEVFPHATATLLAGRLPSGSETKLGFRRQVLDAHSVDNTVLPTVDRVDAALAALTGVLALEGRYCSVGDPLEGVVMLPVATLPAGRLVRKVAAGASSSMRRPVLETPAVGACECGCGAVVRRRFLPGHDAKLKSKLLRAHRRGDHESTDRLGRLGWLPID